MKQEERPGTLIALEGIDGCGKSTQQVRLREQLEARGHEVVALREPGDSEYGVELRRIFVEGRDVTPQQEMRLFLEDRRIDVRDNILPALEAGKVVIMDRYYLSSVVYQGSLELDPQEILAANESFAPKPDLTLILDLDPATARRRIDASRGGPDSFENEDYLARVRDAYLGFVDGDRIRRIDANTTSEVVHEQLLALVLGAVEGKGDRSAR